MSTNEPAFLEAAPDPNLRQRALVANMRQCMLRSALHAGGEFQREHGATWTYAPVAHGESAVLFPRLAAARAGEQLDSIVDYYRQRRPPHSVGCWSLDPPRPRDLGLRLVARGFDWGFRPHWMWLDLPDMRSEGAGPAGLTVEVVGDPVHWDVEDLPYYHRDSAAVPRVAGSGPRRTWHVAAALEGRIVGHSSLCLTTGRLGIAGIYAVGVVPSARRQGIASAVTFAACRLAQQLGCRHAALNATPDGERVYRKLGFLSMGYGQTWWLRPATLAALPPTPAQVAFTEAIGRGEVDALALLGKDLAPQFAQMPLTNGTLPLQLAVRTGQTAVAEWLVAHGALLDVLSAWDLGWQQRVPALLAGNPELANLRSGEWQATPLHAAAMRGDVELARLLLAAHPDLDLEDGAFHATPLGWAQHFGQAGIAEIIGRQRGGAEA